MFFSQITTNTIVIVGTLNCLSCFITRSLCISNWQYHKKKMLRDGLRDIRRCCLLNNCLRLEVNVALWWRCPFMLVQLQWFVSVLFTLSAFFIQYKVSPYFLLSTNPEGVTQSLLGVLEVLPAEPSGDNPHILLQMITDIQHWTVAKRQMDVLFPFIIIWSVRAVGGVLVKLMTFEPLLQILPLICLAFLSFLFLTELKDWAGWVN